MITEISPDVKSVDFGFCIWQEFETSISALGTPNLHQFLKLHKPVLGLHFVEQTHKADSISSTIMDMPIYSFNVVCFAAVTSGPEFEAAVVNLIDMGFEREHVVRCMRASFNNPDRAAEYLMNVSTYIQPRQHASVAHNVKGESQLF